MNVLFAVFALVFIFDAALHLLFIFLQIEVGRIATKILLLPLLFAAALAWGFRPPLTLVLALAAGWAGDIFLVNIGKPKYFMLGLGCFLIGHIFYIATMLRLIKQFNIPVLFISAAVAAAAVFGTYHFVKPGKEMKIPTVVYSGVLVCVAIAALQLFLFIISTMPAPQLIIFDLPGFDNEPYLSEIASAYFMFVAGKAVLCGCVLFMMSDTILAYWSFRRLPRYGNAAVMLPYIFAQCGLFLGLCFLHQLLTGLA